ncbi:MAG: T9SS type A sorting domain-containing protein [Bacteroidota bacterium]
MKQFYTFCFLLLTVLIAHAQRPYEPMLREDAHWVTTVYGFDGETFPFEITLNGDTTFNGTTYQKVYVQSVMACRDYRDTRTRYLRYGNKYLHGFAREDSINRKVYTINAQSGPLSNPGFGCGGNTEILWNDFSLKIGDTLSYCGYQSQDTLGGISLDSTFKGIYGPVETFTTPKRKFTIGPPSASYPLTYWEGIGRYSGFLVSYRGYLGRTDETGLALYCRDSSSGCMEKFISPTTPPPVRPYVPLVHEDAHWIVEVSPNFFYETTLEGDSILNGKTYKKVFNQKVEPVNSNSGEPPFIRSGKRQQEALIREDSAARKVYAVYLNNDPNIFHNSLCSPNQEVLLFDFSTQVLDELVHCQSQPIFQYDREYRPAGEAVTGTPSIVGIDSLQFFYFTLQPDEYFYAEINDRVHVEGIGSTYGLLENRIKWSLYSRTLKYYCRESLGGCPEIWLLNNEGPIPSYLNWKVSQDYTTQTIHIRFADKISDQVVLFDLSGKEVMRKAVNRQVEIDVSIGQLPAGMYVLSAELKGQVVARQKILR